MARILQVILICVSLHMSVMAVAGEFQASDIAKSGVAISIYRGNEVLRSGSGFVVQSDPYNGYVLAPMTLVTGNDTISVSHPRSGASLIAQVLARDASLGLALLKVNGLDVPSLQFSPGKPEVGDVVFSAIQTSGSVALSQGTLVNLATLLDSTTTVLSHSAVPPGNTESASAVLLNECGQGVGVNMRNAGNATSSAMAVDVAAVRSFVSANSIRLSLAQSDCASAVTVARAQATEAAAEAKRAVAEAERAQVVAGELEQKLKASNQRNESLATDARDARARADEAIEAARVAQAHAESTREELEKQSAAFKAETEAMLAFMEKDRSAAEQRFREALAEQQSAAESREQLLIVIGGITAIAAFLGALVVRGRFGGRVAASSPAAAAAEPAGRGGGHTVLHKEELVEYVLDGRDEDGIRYLLRISGDQMLSPDGVVIGRNPKDSPYIINHADVSRRHARMKVMKNRVFIEDLGSTNGTSVNGQAIDDKGPVAVSNGDQIIIGSVVMKLRVLSA